MKNISETDRLRLARLLTEIQDCSVRPSQGGKTSEAEIEEHSGLAHVVGVSGPLGVGKSTLVSQMIPFLRDCGLRVVVLAIDPTSEKTKGALLGDRIRMRDSYADPGVFIRSLATRGAPDALTTALTSMIRVSKAFCDLVIVETAGSGQTDVAVHSMVNTLVVVFAPLGDFVTLMKSGQVEHAHLAVVNEREGMVGDGGFSQQARLALGRDEVDGWRRRVFSMDVSKTEGVEDFVSKGILAHRDECLG